MSGNGDGCPKCGNPRLEGAVDCPYCGIVYDRYLGDVPRRPGPSAPPGDLYDAPGSPQLGDVYREPEVEDDYVEDASLLDSAWGKLAFSALFFFLAWMLNGELLELETGARESIRINWIIALLYENLGRVPTVGTLCAAAALALLLGLRQLLLGSR